MIPLSSVVSSSLYPFHTFIWKIASGCNINCSYCFVYNKADTRWKLQPPLMSKEVAQKTISRIVEHCISHQKKEVSIIFHGGEPLLGGVQHLHQLFTLLANGFKDTEIEYQVGIQSNGLLFSGEIGDLLLESKASIGISVDGPPEVNDKNRVDHFGRPTSRKLEEKLQLLLSPSYRSLFAGFLCVIDPATDPVRVIDYLLQFSPPGIDFLLPHYNHVDLPPEKKKNLSDKSYGDWLTVAFDHWTQTESTTQIRIFESIISTLCGGYSGVESLGTNPIDLIVVETNGDVEAVDSLKSTFEGATSLGYNVFENDFSTIASDPRVRLRQIQVHGLCQNCKNCSIVDICGGGYIPHRYAGGTDFNHPSVYCLDLKEIINHVSRKVESELIQIA